MLTGIIIFPLTGNSTENIVSPFTSAIQKAKPAIVTIFVKKISSPKNGIGSGNRKFFDNALIKDFFGSPPKRNPKTNLVPIPSWGNGSGFIISQDGYIITNHHVIKDAVEITVFLQNKSKYSANLIGSDAQSDIALLRIKGTHLPSIILGDSDTLKVGEWAIAIGSPVEFIQTVTVGIISAKGRSSIGISEFEDFIQTDAAINPGNSGGPLLNTHGEAIGINTAFMTQKGGYSGIGFAVPISMARIVIEQLKKYGHMQRGILGVSLRDCNPEEISAINHPLYKNAAKILKIHEDSPAITAHLAINDLIVAINRKPISGAADLRNKIAMTEPGTQLSLQFFRNKVLLEVKVKIAKSSIP